MKTILLALSLLLAQAQLNLPIAKNLSKDVLLAAEAKQKRVAVALVDEGSNLLYFERSLCAPLGSIETSIQKAKSSALFRKPTSDFVSAVKNGRIGILTAHGVIAVEGGLPIFRKGIFVGAIGVGGASSVEDEAFGNEALKKLSAASADE